VISYVVWIVEREGVRGEVRREGEYFKYHDVIE